MNSRGGLWQAVLISGAVSGLLWDAARDGGQMVGTCGCGGLLRPGVPYEVGRVVWFPGECVTCGRETAGRGA